jgi:glucose/arabinose dehydrogenase
MERGRAIIMSALGVAICLLLPLNGPAHASGLGVLPRRIKGTVHLQPLPPDVELIEIVSGLTMPIAITHAGDGSGRLFIVEQAGTIRVYDGNTLVPTPFLDLSSGVLCCGERGLLSVAFHPDYAQNGYFYVDYTRTGDGATVIERYQVSTDPNVADPDTGTTILTIAQPQSNHNGGQLQFGPDGYLYIGMGDGGGGGDPDNLAQDPGSLLGKMLRIDVDGGSPYSIPLSNPFISNPEVLNEILALGLRNPWRFSFDRDTGDLFIADVGQSTWEEVNFVSGSSGSAVNYGWSCYEGDHDYDTGRDCTALGTLTFPVLEYSHDLGCSITGGYRYRGTQYPALQGVYLYGDYCSGRLWVAGQEDGVWSSEERLNTSHMITAFGENESGEVYLADYGNGVIYQIAASSFADVPVDYWAWSSIEGLRSAGLTGGCSQDPSAYCPEADVTRAQMAVFLERGIHGSGYTPPAATGTVFGDVPTDHWAAAWIEQLYADGITSGCSSDPLMYCPEDPVSRAQMAVFLERAMHWPDSYSPPVGSGTLFADVPGSYWAVDWIEQLYADGITSGCSSDPLIYCPEEPVTRAEMAVFLVKTFDLPAP